MDRSHKFYWAVSALLLWLVSTPLYSYAVQSQGPVTGVIRKVAETRPLIEMTSKASRGRKSSYIVPLKKRERPYLFYSPESARFDRYIQKEQGYQGLVLPGLNFDGIDNIDNANISGITRLPPDPNGDVGYNHYVQVVNVALAVYDKYTGDLVHGPLDLSSLWFDNNPQTICGSDGSGDPVVLFDEAAGRWLVSQFAFERDVHQDAIAPFYQCIAISQSDDPTGKWFLYELLVHETKFIDYPKFGVWPDGYYMSANQFGGFGFNTGAGIGAFVFERDKMLQGQDARFVYFDVLASAPGLFGMLPADIDGITMPPPGSPNYFLTFTSKDSGASSDQLVAGEFHADWTNTANATFTLQNGIDVQPFTSIFTNGILQNIDVTSVMLDPISDRLMYRLQYRNFGTHEAMTVNHTVNAGSDRAGIRWYELRKSGSAWAIYQQGTYAPSDSASRWMGSIAMDKAGNMALGYSFSGVAAFPSIKYTGRASTDPLNVMTEAENTIISGSGCQTNRADLFSRWGDYSMMAVDPVDECTFWYTQEYYESTSSTLWSTRIASFKFSSCIPTNFVLKVNVSGSAGGLVISDPAGINCGDVCVMAFSNGSQVVLTATSATGAQFTGWSGGGCSGTGTCTVIMNDNITVTAQFSTCTFTLSSSQKSFGPLGGRGAVKVKTKGSRNCSWSAASNADWIEIKSKSSFTGNGTVTYSVSTNTSVSPRTGTMTIAGNTFTVVQAGGIPKLSLSATSLKFGTVRTGTTVTRTVSIKNTGTAIVETGSINITGNNASEFTSQSECATIAPGVKCVISVTLTATSFGKKSAVLNISNNTSKSPVTVRLSGNARPPIISLSPSSLKFNPVTVGSTSAAKTIKIRNRGISDLLISTIQISGTNPAEFSLADNTCSAALTARSSCSTAVTFTPADKGKKRATLDIASNDVKHAVLNVRLSGTGK